MVCTNCNVQEFEDINLLTRNVFCISCKSTLYHVKKVTRVLSFGGGRQTCFMLLRHWADYVGGYVIYADIAIDDKEHGEDTLTYQIIEKIIKPFCKERNINFITVAEKHGIWTHSLDHKIIPMRQQRWCTSDFKVKPIHRFYRKKLKAGFKSHVIAQDMGFATDEAHRKKFNPKNPRYLKMQYPLLDQHRTSTKECIEWLNQNYPMVEWSKAKSSCWFCPFAKIKELRRLTDKQKNDMIMLEENNSNPEIFFKGMKPLKMYLGKDSHSLTEFGFKVTEKEDDIICDSGYCFQ